jgi:hypothetical protein
MRLWALTPKRMLWITGVVQILALGMLLIPGMPWWGIFLPTLGVVAGYGMHRLHSAILWEVVKLFFKLADRQIDRRVPEDQRAKAREDLRRWAEELRVRIKGPR